MRNIDKIKRIRSLILDINFSNECYDNEKDGSYFDYVSVIDLLEQAQQRIKDSTRYPRPDNLPQSMAWSDKPFDPDTSDSDGDGFDYTYDGSMSPEDWEKVVAAHENDMAEEQSNKKNINIPEIIVPSDVKKIQQQIDAVTYMLAHDTDDQSKEIHLSALEQLENKIDSNTAAEYDLYKIRFFSAQGAYFKETDIFKYTELNARSDAATQEVEVGSDNAAGWTAFILEKSITHDKSKGNLVHVSWSVFHPMADEPYSYDSGKPV